MIQMPTSEKQKAYAKKHLEKLDEIKIRPAKGTKERWKVAAQAQGKSLTQMIVDAVEAELRKET